MTTNRTHHEILAYEKMVNESFLDWLNRKAGSSPVLPGKLHNGSMSLIGRVELAEYDPVVEGRDYYIGTHYRFEEGSPTVFSWAADGSAVFFGKANPETVRVRRSLESEGPHIVGVTDDWLVEQDAEAFSRSAPEALKAPMVPSPSVPGSRPVLTVPTPVVEQLEPSSPEPVEQPSPLSFLPAPRRGRCRAAIIDASQDVSAMRAGSAVRAALSAPRTEKLSSVLATLQPDQYELVVHKPHVPLAVQGHPGTGKTIVAAHRAAYLVHPARENQQLDKVLLIGPTEHYVHHVKYLVSELDVQDRVTTTSLDAILARIAGLPAVLPFSEREPDFDDISTETGGRVRDVVRRARAAGVLAADMKQARVQVWNMIKDNLIGDTPVTNRFDLKVWARLLPTYAEATGKRRLLPLLAVIGLELAALKDAKGYAHIIVDEVQDVTPLEWVIIRELNAGNGWTLVGDMQQRHSDLSHRSWQSLVQEVFSAHSLEGFEPAYLGRGYRSTEAILAYASKLLPVKERNVHSLQVEGLAPSVIEVAEAELGTGAVALVLELLKRHPEGSAAVIGVDVSSVNAAFRDARGWGQREAAGPWSLGSNRVSVLTPAMARGLEFDVVVVVEPADFTKKRGRNGQLYTSLTRANRDLGVVYSKPLPRGLAPAKPRSGRKTNTSKARVPSPRAARGISSFASPGRR
ncbi:AAA family ATPase [Kineosporia sp. NBRC 101731]|uniref:AAA family ATPase n=1 Tax=Kineosporia sp. NBRC 101731 TaxID=3032199 RepID=UPI0024A3F0E3|nr:AAA family ATPase [Kineosporia sp. NBRC 101731]GLY31603.1 hypothetical protein Kisp02_49680 [Kineosporia sp. NBRC 101731]